MRIERGKERDRFIDALATAVLLIENGHNRADISAFCKRVLPNVCGDNAKKDLATQNGEEDE